MKQYPQLADYELPKSNDVECLLVLSLVSYPEHIFSVRKIVEKEHFFSPNNKALWNKIVEMDDAHEIIDISTFFSKVDAGYFANIMAEYTAKSTSSEIMNLAYTLRDVYMKRATYITIVNGLKDIQEGKDGETIKDEILSRMNGINTDITDKGIKNAVVLINELAAELQKPYGTRIASHIRTLDFNTYGGFSGSKFIVMGARPGVGKTTLGLQFAQEAVRQNKNVLFFSTEMNGTELMQRLLFSTGLVTAYEFASKNINWDNFERASAMVTSERLNVVYGKISLKDLITKAKSMYQQGKCDFIVVDYIQNVVTDDKAGTPQAVVIGNITRELKLFANEHDIPVLGLAQLNRDSANEERKPRITDLKGSGAIEQDADLILLLDKGREGTTILEDRIDMWISKNRQGRITLGEPIYLKGDENYANFIEI